MGILSRFRGASHQTAQKPITVETNDEECYGITHGRFLWDNEKQLKGRYRKFSTTALQEIAVSKLSAKRCISMTKISEKGGNKIFLLAMDNRKLAVAKIPHERSASGPLRLSSEVATMDFASTILKIPVPKVLAWSADEHCPVGSEYILMEHAQGTLLKDIWDGSSADEKAEVLADLAVLCGKFQSVRFSSIGNLYFASDNISGAVPAIAVGNILPNLKQQIQQRYTIGPATEDIYWEGQRAKIALQGPWQTSKQWWDAIADREVTWLEEYAGEREQLPLLSAPSGTKEEHIGCWKSFKAASSILDAVKPELLQPTLWHSAVKAENIFVHKKKITAFIDWEGSWVKPLMLTHREPWMLLFRPDEMNMPTREQLASITDPEEQAKAMKAIGNVYLRYAWQHTLFLQGPVFEQLEVAPGALHIQQLVLQARETWQLGYGNITQVLHTLAQLWSEIAPGTTCPYEVSQEEVDKLAREAAISELRGGLLAIAFREMEMNGYVKHGDYIMHMKFFEHVRDKIMPTVEDEQAKQAVIAGFSWMDKA